MILFETVLQDLRYGARLAPQCPVHRRVGSLLWRSGLASTRLPSPLTRRSSCDLSMPATRTRWSTSRCVQSGVTNARFSYPDYEAYRDHLHSFNGVIAFSIDQLKLTGAGGLVSQRSAGWV
jgi:hypothetical protein